MHNLLLRVYMLALVDGENMADISIDYSVFCDFCLDVCPLPLVARDRLRYLIVAGIRPTI